MPASLPALKNLKYVRGDTFDLAFTWYRNGVVADLSSGWRCDLTAADPDTGAAAFTASSTGVSPAVTLAATAPNVTFSLPLTGASHAAGEYRYDVQLATTTGSYVRTVLKGSLEIGADVTQVAGVDA